MEKIRYSQQSEILIETFGDNFDKKDFERWFNEHFVIGSNLILTYLMQKKEAIRNKIINR